MRMARRTKDGLGRHPQRQTDRHRRAVAALCPRADQIRSDQADAVMWMRVQTGAQADSCGGEERSGRLGGSDLTAAASPAIVPLSLSLWLSASPFAADHSAQTATRRRSANQHAHRATHRHPLPSAAPRQRRSLWPHPQEPWLPQPFPVGPQAPRTSLQPACQSIATKSLPRIRTSAMPSATCSDVCSRASTSPAAGVTMETAARTSTSPANG